MAENYEVLKQNNLNQLVAEYENEKQNVYDTNAKRKQYSHDLMKEAALQELADIRERELDLESPFSLWAEYDPRGYLLCYKQHFYDNAWANLVRKYAVIHDAKNIDKYPIATPLPRMETLLSPYTPCFMTYKKLAELAAYCPRHRQK